MLSPLFHKSLLASAILLTTSTTYGMNDMPDAAFGLFVDSGVAVQSGDRSGGDFWIVNDGRAENENFALDISQLGTKVTLVESGVLEDGIATTNVFAVLSVGGLQGTGSGVGINMSTAAANDANRSALIADNLTVLSDKTGIKVTDTNLELTNSYISSYKEGLEIDNSAGGKSSILLKNVNIKYDPALYNKVMQEYSAVVGDIDPDTKNSKGVLANGNGVAGETNITITDGSYIDVGSFAIAASNAAKVKVESSTIVTTNNLETSVAANDAQTQIELSDVTIKTNGTAATANSNAHIIIKDSTIERNYGGFGAVARAAGQIDLTNTQITLTGGDYAGSTGWGLAAIGAREKDSKVILNHVTIDDRSATDKQLAAKAFYVDSGGLISGSDVHFYAAQKEAIGATIYDEDSKIILSHSDMSLTGKNSIAVTMSNGSFIADDVTIDTHMGFVIDGSVPTVTDKNIINLTNSRIFTENSLLLATAGNPFTGDFSKVQLAANHTYMQGIMDGIGTDVVLENASHWQYTGYSNLGSLKLTDSLVSLDNPSSSNSGQTNKLEVGNLNSTNGVIELWTQFLGDNSKTDQILINDSATGKTGLRFKKYDDSDGA